MELGQFWKEKRIEAGMSQGEVARILGYTSGQLVSNWERGASSVPLKKIRRLCRVFGVPRGTIKAMYLEKFERELDKVI